jgi:hypothetical protein
MTIAINPLNELLNSAESIREALGEASDNLVLAIEHEAAKRRIAKETRENSDAIVAEWEAEAMNRDRSVINGDGKPKSPTVDQIKALVAAERVVAQRQGLLAKPLAMMNAAAYDHEDAKMALEQASKRFRATEAAADLTAAMLRAAAR